MANGQGGVSPLQQFIQNYMDVQQFMEIQRQAGAREALAGRQADVMEMGSFMELARGVERPEELTALVSHFDPEGTKGFEALAQNLVPSLETLRTGAVRRGMVGGLPEGAEEAAALGALTGMAPGQFAEQQALGRLPQEAWDRTLAIAQGRALSEGDEQQLRLAWEQFGFDKTRFDETIRQFGVEVGLRQIALQLQSRGLDIEEMSAIDRRNLGMAGLHVQGRTWPEFLRGEHSQMIGELQAQLQGPISPQRRAVVEGQIRDIQTSMERMNDLWEAQLANLIGPLGSEGIGGMTLNQLFQADETALSQVGAAKDEGEREAARQRLQMVRFFLGELGAELGGLERRRGLTGWRPFGIPRPSQITPPPGGQR